MLNIYARIAWRNITRRKVYAIINILGLSIGLSTCIVIYLIAHFEFSFDRSHPDKERIYRIITEKAGQGDKLTIGFVPSILPLIAKQSIPGLEALAGYHLFPARISISGGKQPEREYDNRIAGNSIPATIITEPEYFSIFKYEWIAGGPKSSLSDPYQVVLSESKARKYFGDLPLEQVVGKEIAYNDSLRVKVSGIVRDWKGNTDFPFNEFISFSTIKASFLRNAIRLDDWGTADIPWDSRIIIKLINSRSAGSVDAQLALLAKDHIKSDAGIKCTLSLQPLSGIHYDMGVSDGLPKANLPMLYVLMGVGVFILLLAVVNFINLSTAMSMLRAKEVGIRKILGSSNKVLFMQFLVETSMLTLFALLISVLAVKPALTLLHSFIPTGVSFAVLSPSTLFFLFLIALVTSLLSGLYPARIISSYLPLLCLTGDGVKKGSEKGWLRKGLIVFQFSISLIFIICTIVVGRQIHYMRNEELGFSTSAIISINTDMADTSNRADILAEKIRKIPGVSMVARESFTPTSDLHTMIPLRYKGKRVMETTASLQLGDENFIPLYQMQLIAGRNLGHSDSLREWVINESLSKDLGFADPGQAIGKSLFLGDQSFPIVGVVADFHEYSYHEAIKPCVIADIARGSGPEPGIAVKLVAQVKRLNNLTSSLRRMERLWKQLYPNLPFNYSFLDDSISSLYEKEENMALLMNTAMIITIFISCIGLFGVAMFTGKQRTKEMGIRKVLGANIGDIAMLLSKSIVKLIAIAILISSPIAWYFMNRWLQDFAYRIDIRWWMFLLAGLMAMVIALFTVGFQTLKMAFVDPVEALGRE